MTTQTETQRMLNVGEEIAVKCLSEDGGVTPAKVRVKELSLDKVITLASDLFVVLEKVQISDIADAASGGAGGLEWLGEVLKNESTQTALHNIAGATTDSDPARWATAGLTDWMRWAVALKKIMDWEELRELFMELIPPGTLTNLKTSDDQSQD